MCGSIQSQFGVQVPFFSRDQSLTLSTLPVPCWGITLYAKWARMSSCHVLGVSCDGVAAVRERGGFSCGASVSTSHASAAQAPPRDQVTSVSHNWVFFLVGRKVVFLVSQPDKRACLPCIAPQAWSTLPMACIACSPGKMSFHVKFHFLRAPSQGHGS